MEQGKTNYQQIIALCQKAGVIEGEELTERGLLLIVDRILAELPACDCQPTCDCQK